MEKHQTHIDSSRVLSFSFSSTSTAIFFLSLLLSRLLVDEDKKMIHLTYLFIFGHFKP
ncbi:hypothetical protein Scep_021919 [Stephania cephalantha]|uniref:Transmembrane protein n=1 Tax=Stephania cephalantha TaxID=152367 RepID=A0AAP0I1U5_9MAGN